MTSIDELTAEAMALRAEVARLTAIIADGGYSAWEAACSRADRLHLDNEKLRGELAEARHACEQVGERAIAACRLLRRWFGAAPRPRAQYVDDTIAFFDGGPELAASRTRDAQPAAHAEDSCAKCSDPQNHHVGLGGGCLECLNCERFVPRTRDAATPGFSEKIAGSIWADPARYERELLERHEPDKDVPAPKTTGDAGQGVNPGLASETAQRLLEMPAQWYDAGLSWAENAAMAVLSEYAGFNNLPSDAAATGAGKVHGLIFKERKRINYGRVTLPDTGRRTRDSEGEARAAAFREAVAIVDGYRDTFKDGSSRASTEGWNICTVVASRIERLSATPPAIREAALPTKEPVK